MELIYSSGSYVFTGSCFSGIYGWQCHKTSQWNVGESKHVLTRMDAYLDNRIPNQVYMSHAIDKYGICEFSCYKLEECPIEMLHEREVYWGTLLNSMAPNGYNLRLGGSGKHITSEETKKKISAALTGRPTGRKGVKMTDEQRRINSLSHIGLPSARKGVTLSDETKQKISTSNKGRVPSEYNRKRSAETNKGNTYASRIWGEEEKKRKSKSLLGNTYARGFKHTNETKMKVKNGMRISKLVKWLEKEAPWFLETSNI